MSIFGKIKDAIFGRREEAAAAPRPATAVPSATPVQPRPQPQPLAEVDVEAKLDGLPGSGNLNWRTSIVDLMKLIGLEASYGERKELAQELGRTDYSGTAEDNIWLHDRVMDELARNGGKVPARLRD